MPREICQALLGHDVLLCNGSEGLRPDHSPCLCSLMSNGLQGEGEGGHVATPEFGPLYQCPPGPLCLETDGGGLFMSPSYIRGDGVWTGLKAALHWTCTAQGCGVMMFCVHLLCCILHPGPFHVCDEMVCQGKGDLFGWQGRMGYEFCFDFVWVVGLECPKDKYCGAAGFVGCRLALHRAIARCVCVTDGTLWMWGRNAYGQLGDGTTDHKNRPVQVTVTGCSNVSHIALGRDHSAALCAGMPVP